MQAGTRRYPEPPFPRLHQSKPGREDKLDPPPMHDAPFYKGSQKLKGKVALITGRFRHRPRGGRALRPRGRRCSDPPSLRICDAEVTRQAVEAEGQRCLVMAGDVTSRAFCFKALARTVKVLGGLDVSVNNAAYQLHVSRFEDLTEAHFDRTMKTSLYGYFHMAQAALPHLKPGSAIGNTGSVTGLHGNKGLIDYSTTKGGIHAFTRSLSTHLVPRGIRVNAVAPGPVWTPLNPADRQAAEVATFGATTPMKRPAQPEEIAPAFVFLASAHCSSYITGEILPIIGGYGGG